MKKCLQNSVLIYYWHLIYLLGLQALSLSPWNIVLAFGWDFPRVGPLQISTCFRKKCFLLYVLLHLWHWKLLTTSAFPALWSALCPWEAEPELSSCWPVLESRSISMKNSSSDMIRSCRSTAASISCSCTLSGTLDILSVNNLRFCNSRKFYTCAQSWRWMFIRKSTSAHAHTRSDGNRLQPRIIFHTSGRHYLVWSGVY